MAGGLAVAGRPAAAPPDQLLQLHKALGAPGPRCQGRHAHLRRDGLPGGHIRSDGLT